MKKVIILGIIVFILLIIALAITYFRTSKVTPEISTVLPINQSTSIDLSTNIQITFTSPFSANQISQVILNTQPEIIGEKRWSVDHKTLTLTPIKPLNFNQRYDLTINYSNKIYSWNFTTKSSQEITLADQAKIQTEADKRYSDLQEDVLGNYPWYNDLPLQSKNYFVLFDLQKKVFRAKLYPQKSSSSSVEDQVQVLKDEVLAKLKSLSIDANFYTIEWIVNPE